MCKTISQGCRMLILLILIPRLLLKAITLLDKEEEAEWIIRLTRRQAISSEEILQISHLKILHIQIRIKCNNTVTMGRWTKWLKATLKSLLFKTDSKIIFNSLVSARMFQTEGLTLTVRPITPRPAKQTTNYSIRIWVNRALSCQVMEIAKLTTSRENR